MTPLLLAAIRRDINAGRFLAHDVVTLLEYVDQLTGERDRARDLAVRSGAFTRRDDAHSLADLPDWEN